MLEHLIKRKNKMKALQPKNDEEIIESIIKNIKTIYDPEIPINIHDLGLIYNIKLEMVKNYKHCTIDMTLTSPGCPVSDSLMSDVYYYTLSVPEIDEVNVNLTFAPPWDFSKISQEGKDILELEGTVIPAY